MDPKSLIPKEEAMQICAEIREENRRNWLSISAMQCWGCVTFTGNNPEKMCISNAPGFRGCSLVNDRYDRAKT